MSFQSMLGSGSKNCDAKTEFHHKVTPDNIITCDSLDYGDSLVVETADHQHKPKVVKIIMNGIVFYLLPKI